MRSACTALILSAAAMGFACGGDDGEELPSLSTEDLNTIAGVYIVDGFEGSEDGCGPAEDRRSLLADDRLVIVPQSLLGQAFASVMSCSGTMGCNERVAQLRGTGTGIAIGAFTTAVSAFDGTAFSGQGVSSGFLINGQCEMASVTTTGLERTGDQLTIDFRMFEVAPFPPEDGVCFTSGAEVSPQGQCLVYRRVTATYERALP